MTKTIIVGLCAFLLHLSQIFGQKPRVNPFNLRWNQQIYDAKISPNGRYVSYNLSSMLYLVDADGKKLDSFANANQAVFSQDGKWLVFKQHRDSLVEYDLTKKKASVIDHSTSFQLLAANIILYKVFEKFQLKRVGKAGVTPLPEGNYVVHPSLSKMVIYNRNKLYWINPMDRLIDSVESPGTISSPCFDHAGRKLAFFSVKDKSPTIQLYEKEKKAIIEWLSEEKVRIISQMNFANEALAFNKSDDKLLLYLQPIKKDLTGRSLSNVLLLTSKDDNFPTNKMSNYNPKEAFLSYVKVYDSKVTVIETLDNLSTNNSTVDNILLLKSKERFDSFYNERNYPSLSYFNLTTGKHSLVAERSSRIYNDLTIAPDEKYVVWFNPDSLTYFSHSFVTGETINISSNISTSIYDEENQQKNRTKSYGIAGWTNDSKYILVYDEFDVWKIDLGGKEQPINVTKGIGKRNGIHFGIIRSDQGKPIILNKSLLLSGYNGKTKQNGLFKLGDIIQATDVNSQMCDCNYYSERVGTFGFNTLPTGSLPLKAVDKEVYLLTWQTSESSPNLVTTKDFKRYQKLTNNQPQEKVNWIKGELHNFPALDGKMQQGILYKPEDFDSTHAYPLIFNYYEKRSDGLHNFLYPQLVMDNVDVPSFVSNGYLVFIPDIYSKPGFRGEGTINSVVGATKYMSKYKWVNTSKIAIQGHSYGGFQTNYLVTHTNDIFAAACEMAGGSNSISSYNQVTLNGAHRGTNFEIFTQGAAVGKGVTPWTNPEIYIRESSVLNVGKVTTPLLMVHNRNDNLVPFEQAVELFTSLKRAQKDVWFLEYENEDHALFEMNSQKDFTIRLFQFFNHYLKNHPPPVWMTTGIPPHLRNVMTGYKADLKGACSEKCKVCNEKKYATIDDSDWLQQEINKYLPK